MSFVFVTLFVIFLQKVKRAMLMHFLRGRGRGAVNKVYCYIAGNFFITVRALIGFFEVT